MFKNRFQMSLLIFVLAFIVRIGLIGSHNVDFVPSDGINYHDIAVNLANGQGYSNSLSAPFEPYFFREPTYPLFMSSIYSVYRAFGGELKHINYGDVKHNECAENNAIRKEMIWVKIAQALIDSFTCVMFFLLLSMFFSHKKSLIAIILYAMYFPIAIYTSLVLRETLQLFLIMGCNLSLIAYLRTKRKYFLIILSFLYTALILTLQIHVLLFPLICVFLFIDNRSFAKTIRDGLILFILTIVLLSPWLYRSYRFYPDIRVIKNVGLSFTNEQLNWVSSLIKAKKYKLITQSEFRQQLKEWYQTPEFLKFQYSFNGHYTQMSDSLKALTAPFEAKETSLDRTKHTVTLYFKRLENTLFVKLSLSRRSLSDCISSREYWCLIPYALGILIGLGGALSLLLNFRKSWLMYLPILFYLPLFKMLADESRRMIVVHAYLFIFFALGALYCLDYLKKKRRARLSQSLYLNT